MNQNKCLPPTASFTVDGQEGVYVTISDEELALWSDKKYRETKSYSECIIRQNKILSILKQNSKNGKLMRFRKWLRCNIGWHSWYSFYGCYSVCDNCGIIKK